MVAERQGLLRLRELMATVVLLLRSCCGDASSFHTVRVGYTSASEAIPGLPAFTATGYVDDELIAFYETNTRRLQPRASWMHALEEEDLEFCRRYNRILQKDAEDFQENVVMLQKRYNQSVGFHIVQMMIVCEVTEDGSRRGRWQYGYDGRDFLSFNMETGAWTATDKEAQLIKQWWEKGTAILQRFKGYLESTCKDWLQKDQLYRLHQSLRKVAPSVTVSSRKEASGMETLICRAHGFYPKEIDISWVKDGENLDHETFRGIVSPNSDETFYASISISVDPEERAQYRCQVNHDGLQETLEKMVKAAGNIWGIVIGSVVAFFVLLAIICVIILVYRRSHRLKHSRCPLQE